MTELDTPADEIAPANEADLADAVAAADCPLRVLGGGTRPLGVPMSGRALSTRRLAGITLYEPGALTLVAASGTPLAEIEAALSAEGQVLPFEPMDHRALLGTAGTPTIGGVVAAAASGPRMVQAGGVRDSLIGVRFVDGTGAAVSNGGRVMKNVTGYDLVKLMAGSFGTLGVLSEVAFKLQPRAERVATLRCEGLADAAALQAMTTALSTPFEVSGAAHLQAGMAGRPATMLRLEGFEGAVAYRSEELKARLSDIAEFVVETDPQRNAAGWEWVRDVKVFAERPGDVWQLGVKPTDAAALVARLSEAEAFYDQGGSRVWLLVPEGTDVRAALGAFEGRATLIRAADATRTALRPFHPPAPGVARLEAGLRRQFDPRGILNPGLMG